MCRNIPKLLTAPADAIMAAKKKSSYGDALGTLIVDGIVVAVAVAVIAQVPTMSSLIAMLGGNLGVVVVSAFVLVFLGALFFGLLTKLIVNTLGGDGTYLHGLVTIAYSIAAPSVGLLVTAIFLNVPVAGAGALAAFVALSIAFSLGIATLYRAIKELFAADLVTSLVAVGVLTLVITMTAWVVVVLGTGSLLAAGIA